MSHILPITDTIYRIQIPFEAIYTTAYVAKYEDGVAIIDSGDKPADVDDYILPALVELGIHTTDVRYLLLTHDHGDHAGGIRRLAECFPNAIVRASFPMDIANFAPLVDEEVLLGGLQVLFLPGHNRYATGYFDLPTGTLLSGDCLQLSGVDKYRNGVAEPEMYVQSVEKLLAMPSLHRIAAAHEYDPYGCLAEGKDEVERYLRYCMQVK